METRSDPVRETQFRDTRHHRINHNVGVHGEFVHENDRFQHLTAAAAHLTAAEVTPKERNGV